MAIITSPLVVPSMTWYRAVSANWASDSGVCTAEMTWMPPVSMALSMAAGSWK
jgi:hypothetical protein